MTVPMTLARLLATVALTENVRVGPATLALLGSHK